MKKISLDTVRLNTIVIFLVVLVLVIIFFIVSNESLKTKHSRDIRRQQDVDSLLHEFKQFRDQNKGLTIRSVYNMTPHETYMIVYGNKRKGCDDMNSYCDVKVTSDTHCVDLSELVDYGMYEDSPIAPDGKVQWDKGVSNGSNGIGYTLSINERLALTITSCESEEEGLEVIYSSDLKK